MWRNRAVSAPLAPLTVEDLVRFVSVTELALAPDGHTLAFTRVVQDGAADERRSAIWLLDCAEPEQPARQFTAGTAKDSSPVWSPDGEWLAFCSTRDQGKQIWIMPAHGGEPCRLTRMRYGAEQPCWSPDGKQICFLTAVRDGESPVQAGDTPNAENEATRLRHVTRLQYRWDGFDIFDGRNHVFTIPVDATLPREEWSEAKQITVGDFDHDSPKWSPDGTLIAFVSDRADDRDANRSDDVWVQDLATGEVTRVSTIPALNSKLNWGPEGLRLAWLAEPTDPAFSHTNQHIWLAERQSGGVWQTRDVLYGQDLNIGQGINGDVASPVASPPIWSKSGDALFVTACARGANNILRVRVLDGATTQITTGPLQFGPIALVNSERQIVGILATPERPCDIALIELAGLPAPARWLTEANPWLSERALGVPQEFLFHADDGWELQGWILWPPDASDPAHQGKRWPVILQIHGGPHGTYGPNFFALLQIFAGAGYAVVFLNPRGSIGYGETFARACDRDWGGGDYHDIMSGLAEALRRGGVDPTRMAVTGTSYGGYMTNWIIGHTQRFKAAVTINSVSNLISSFGTSDVDATFGVIEQGGTPWDHLEFYLERSPVTYAPRITTPTRVIGAERDWRCPIEQSEQMYTAIKALGNTETDFIRVPGVSHAIAAGTPNQRVAQRRAILEWIQRFVPNGPME
jgi:dipeptidyl aminopeptidase/acylaminoacyl peptidase